MNIQFPEPPEKSISCSSKSVHLLGNMISGIKLADQVKADKKLLVSVLFCFDDTRSYYIDQDGLEVCSQD